MRRVKPRISRKTAGKSWYVYILRCKGFTLYTGITTDLQRRFEEHRNRRRPCRGARYTGYNPPAKIAYTEKYQTRSQAAKREYEIKSLSRAAKLNLVARRPASDKGKA